MESLGDGKKMETHQFKNDSKIINNTDEKFRFSTKIMDFSLMTDKKTIRESYVLNYSNLETFYNDYASKILSIDENLTLFEYLQPKQYTKFYLDYDEETYEPVSEDIKRFHIEHKCKPAINLILSNLKGATPDNVKILEYTRYGDGLIEKAGKKLYKISIRFVINIKIQHELILTVLNRLKIDCFDKKVYAGNQKYNMFGCCKYDLDWSMPFWPSEDGRICYDIRKFTINQLRDYVIQDIEDDLNLLDANFDCLLDDDDNLSVLSQSSTKSIKSTATYQDDKIKVKNIGEAMHDWALMCPNTKTTREMWLNVMSFFKRYSTYEDFELWSEKHPEHDERADYKKWKEFNRYEWDQITLGTLRFYFKEENESLYKQWVLKHIIMDEEKQKQIITDEYQRYYAENDEDVAKITFELIKTRFIYSKEQFFYRLDSNIWTNLNGQIDSAVRTKLLDFQIYKKEVKEIKGGTQTKEIKYCAMNSRRNNVYLMLKDMVIANPKNDFYDEFHSSTLGKICFDDGVYNFRENRFDKWDSEYLKQNPVYSLVKINRPFPDLEKIDQEEKKNLEQKIFINSMGIKEYKHFIHYISRAIAGEIDDKQFCIIRTNRNASKGTINDWFLRAFGDYIKNADTQNFVLRSESTDAAKANMWLIPFQFRRIMFCSEAPATNNKQNSQEVLLNGRLIKMINSGGDVIEGRGHGAEPFTFNVQCSTIFMCNDMPKFNQNDVYEQCLEIKTTKQFVSQEEIDIEIKSCFDEKGKLINKQKFDIIPTKFSLADPTVRHIVKTNQNADILVSLIIDNYKKTKLSIKKDTSDDTEISLLDKITMNFQITKNKSDKITNKELKAYAEEYKTSLKKLKTEILQFDGVEEYKSNSEHGIRGIIYLSPE